MIYIEEDEEFPFIVADSEEDMLFVSNVIKMHTEEYGSSIVSAPSDISEIIGFCVSSTDDKIVLDIIKASGNFLMIGAEPSLGLYEFRDMVERVYNKNFSTLKDSRYDIC